MHQCLIDHQPIKIDVDQSHLTPTTTTTTAVSSKRSSASPSSSSSIAAAKRHSPRISSRQLSPRISTRQKQQEKTQVHEKPRTIQGQEEEKAEAAAVSNVCDSVVTVAPAPAPAPAPTVEEPPAALPSSSAAVSVAGHNLRPKRTLRHVNALKQQAKRRKKNTAVAAGGSPRVQRTMSARAAGPAATAAVRRPAGGVNANGDVELAYRPTAKEIADGRKLATMKEVLATIPGFSLGKNLPSGSSKKAPKKLSAAAAIQQVRDGILDLETQDSILGQVNLRLLLNKATFAKLPPLHQFKLLQLLPEVDTTVDPATRAVYLSHSGLNNEFLSKSVSEWKEVLLGGERLPEVIARAKADEDKERLKLDPFKMKHFEPIWGIVARSLDDGDESDEDAEAEAAKEAEQAEERRAAARSRSARAKKRAAASAKQATTAAAEEEVEVTGSKKPRVDPSVDAFDGTGAEAAAAAQVAAVDAATASAASAATAAATATASTEEEDQIDSEMATAAAGGTDEIDLARRVQAEIEESALTFVTATEATLAEREQEEAAIDDEMMDDKQESVIEEPVIEDHINILDEDGSVHSSTIIDDVMSLPTPTASPPPQIMSAMTSSSRSSPAPPRSPAASSVASVASVASAASAVSGSIAISLPTMPTPQITATVLNAIPPPGSTAASVAAVAIRYAQKS